MRKIQDKLSVHMTHHSNKQSGFTLVEMMIAAAIGAVLLGGMISVFLGNKKTADLNGAPYHKQTFSSMLSLWQLRFWLCRLMRLHV